MILSSKNTLHDSLVLTLALFVLRVFTDNAHDTLAPDDLAILA